MAKNPPSEYQAAIYEWVRHGEGNAVVNAVAGSGKTTTIVDALDVVHRGSSVLFLAFNRHIAAELRTRVNRNVKVSTLNGFGWGAVMSRCPDAILEKNKTVTTLKRRVFGLRPESLDSVDAETLEREAREDLWPGVYLSNDAADLIRDYRSAAEKSRRKLWRDQKAVYERIISLLKATGARDGLDWRKVASSYGVDMGEVNADVADLIVAPLYDAVSSNLVIHDFDDQCFMPVRYGWPTYTYDWVFGDEIQDWTHTQTQLVMKAIRPETGRFCGVGDPYQSIYGFRGADFNAVPNIVRATNATQLKLSVCYRCPTSVVAEAARIVKEIEPAPGKAVGSVEWMPETAFETSVRPGDYVLCRTTAPLVEACFEQLRRNKPAVVKGRDIVAGLISRVEHLATRKGGEDADLSMTAEQFIGRLVAWKDDQVIKLMEADKEDEITRVIDTFEVLCVFACNAQTVAGIIAAIERLFSDADDAGRIIFATVHRSKGLQAPTVYILRPELMPFPKAKTAEQFRQEMNLKYVAITRAQERLIWVETPPKEKPAAPGWGEDD